MTEKEQALLKEIISVLSNMEQEELIKVAETLNKMIEKSDIDNKRKHPRKKVFIPTDIKLGDKKIIDFIEDISEGGMFIRGSTMSFYRGQVVELDFNYNGVEHINIKGKIVRIADNGIGIKFIRR